MKQKMLDKTSHLSAAQNVINHFYSFTVLGNASGVTKKPKKQQSQKFGQVYGRWR